MCNFKLHHCFGILTLFVIVPVMLGFLIMFLIINVKFELYSTFSEKHFNVLNNFLKT